MESILRDSDPFAGVILDARPASRQPRGFNMESWRTVWREGVAPVLPTKGLEALAAALEKDDPRLIQASTTTPPPLMCTQDWPVEAACVLGFCGWHGEGLDTVGGVEAYFGKACRDADARLGEPAASRWFLNWFDDTPRDEMRRELLAEVRNELELRAAVESEELPSSRHTATLGRVLAADPVTAEEIEAAGVFGGREG